MQVTLNIYSGSETRQVPLEGARLTLGRGEAASLVLNDDGLSRVHASIHRDGERVWVLDEGSTNGTFVNGAPVPGVGTPINDGDEISVGNETTIVVSFTPEIVSTSYEAPAVSMETPALAPGPAPAPAKTTSEPLSTPKIAAIFAGLIVFLAAVALVSYAFIANGEKKREQISYVNENTLPTPFPSFEETPEPSPWATEQTTVTNETTSDPTPETTVVARKLYLQMTPQEQMEFIEAQARHVSLMMGNRPYTFNDDVLRYIKQYVDSYARRVGNNSTRLWGEDLRFMFARAREQYVPHIIRAFNGRGVPPVVGVYLVVVETEYNNIKSENFAGAAGLFQFIAPTARGYGVDPSERTNVEKMAPAAAAYMADRIGEFGPDSMSVALAIAGYNRSPDSVRRDLSDVLNSENRERSFWTLVANSNKLDHYFQGENIKYVPKFFGAAIVGENPWVFGIQMQPLSTYTDIKAPLETSGRD